MGIALAAFICTCLAYASSFLGISGLYMNQNYDALVEACSKFLAADGSIYDNATQELDLALTDSYYSWFEDFEAALPREITLVMLQHGVNPEPYLYEYAYDDDITFNSPA